MALPTAAAEPTVPSFTDATRAETVDDGVGPVDELDVDDGDVGVDGDHVVGQVAGGQPSGVEFERVVLQQRVTDADDDAADDLAPGGLGVHHPADVRRPW